jgi:hypothetical protein
LLHFYYLVFPLFYFVPLDLPVPLVRKLGILGSALHELLQSFRYVLANFHMYLFVMNGIAVQALFFLEHLVDFGLPIFTQVIESILSSRIT